MFRFGRRILSGLAGSVSELKAKVATLRGAPDTQPYQLVEAELKLAYALMEGTDQTQAREALQLGESLWERVTSGRVELPETFGNVKFQLSLMMQRASFYAEDKEAEKRWSTRQAAGARPRQASTKPPNPFEERAAVFRVQTHSEHQKIAKREAGAFEIDGTGQRRTLFHSQHSLLGHPWRKNMLGGSWEDGPRYTK